MICDSRSLRVDWWRRGAGAGTTAALTLLIWTTANGGGADPQAGPAWQRLADMPLAVIEPAASVAGRRLVVTGGVCLDGSASTSVQVLDLDRMRWSRPTKLTTPRYGHKQVTLPGGRVLVGGGRGREAGAAPSALESCELIEADLARSTPTAPLPTSMATPTMHQLPDGRVIAIGDSLAAVFDPASETWTSTTKLREFRREHASVLLASGAVLVGGGIGKSSFEQIDPGLGKTRRLTVTLPMPLDDLAMVQLPDGRVWVLGGQQVGGDTVDRTWILEPKAVDDSAAWGLVEGPALGVPGGIADHIVIKTSGSIVLAGGESQVSHRDSELAVALWLDPGTLAVHRLPDMDVPHDDAAGVVVGDTVIVLGGQATMTWMGIQVPTPVRAVHRLDLAR